MKYLKYNISRLAIICFAFFVSCDYEDVNQDPTRPGGAKVELNSIVPAMQTQTHRNITAALARHAGIIMQHWEGSDAQQLQFTAYQIGEDGPGSNTLWEFGFYTGAMRDAADIIERATEMDAPNTRGLAKIYMAINLGMEELYGALQDLLAGAITDLEAEDPAEIQGSLISATQEDWISAAHALKARFYIQQTSVRNDAAQMALDEVILATGSNDEQLNFSFENTQNGGHPLALFGINRPNTMIVSNYFQEVMDNDPRKNLYMEESSGGDFLFFQSKNPNLHWGQLDSRSPVISYSELKFIEAEAKVRIGEDGSSVLEEAISANMEYLGISAEEISSYLESVVLSGTVEEQIEIIITEKYKALYGQSTLQVWNDYRRTGYPAITPNPDGDNGNNPSGIVPRRLLYPLSERLGNPDSYQQAIDAQGGHLLDDDIWVFPMIN